MGYAEKRGDYWRGRYKVSNGRYGTVKDDNGATIRFRTKREAEQAANDLEARIRADARVVGSRPSADGQISFGDFASAWYARQDLAASTMQNYRRHLENHLLPAFEDSAIVEIEESDVVNWEKRERAAGYAEDSIRTWRATLHLLLADAVEEGRRETNPAARRRGRGKRAGRSRRRAPEKAVTTALGILLIAERAALLSGRDDEFVVTVLKGWTGMRWGELVGLETAFARSGVVRVEWQLYELDTGEFHRCPPKDDSYRTIDVPDWLSGLLAEQVSRAGSKRCGCHERTYVFRGHRPPPGAKRLGKPTLADVARLAEVSPATVSAAFNHPGVVRSATRAAIANAAAELGYVRGGSLGELSAHWRRSNFATWVFQPAAIGRYPSKGRLGARPVPVTAEPWPGVPVRGRNAHGRADACWVPIAPRLTPHGLRHTHRTLLEELGTPGKLSDERMGHLDGSVQGRYTHVTATMREQLTAGLTDLWNAALADRRGLAPRSAVGVLDRLLSEDGRNGR